MLRFTDGTLDATGLDKLHLRSNQHNALEFLLNALAERIHLLKRIAERLGLQLHMHHHAVKAGLVIHNDAVMRRDALDA